MKIQGFPFSPNGANCYLVKTESAAIVIDPFDTDNRIEEFFAQNPKEEKYIFLTHCHFDHILGALKLREKWDAKIIIGKEDEAGLFDTNISLSSWVGLIQKPFRADITVEDGEKLNLGGTEFTVIHTPGHTAGSVCYAAEDVIFTGDTIFKDCVGRTDFPTGDFKALENSLNRLRNLEKDYKIYSGHGEPTTLYREISKNPYMK